MEIKILKVSGCALLLFVVASAIFPLFAYGNPMSKGRACLSNVKRQTTGFLMYADDHDGRLPLRDAWMDGIQAYVESEPILHDPEGPKGGYGYAFNAALSGARVPHRSETVPMVYDSVNPIRNASDRVTSLPRRGRHKGRDVIAYADGHATWRAVGKGP